MILVCGESLIDLLPGEDAGGRGVFLPAPGGSPFNVALALGRLDAPVRFLGTFSRDAFGDLLVRTLEASGVDLSLCPRAEALSTLGFVSFEGGGPRYAFYTEGTAGSALAAADIPERLPTEIRCLHFGSISLVLEPIGSTLEALLRRERGGRVISVDPNVRPFLVRDRDASLSRLNRFLAAADVIKMSEEDLAWLEPGLAADRACDVYLSRGAKLVLLTRGAGGAIAGTPSGRAAAPARRVDLADTVGAGDTFQAAVLDWLVRNGRLDGASIGALEGTELRALLDFAVRAAAVTCSRPGCDPPWGREISENAAGG